MKNSLRRLAMVGIIVLVAIAAGIGLLQMRRSDSPTPVVSVNQNSAASNSTGAASSTRPAQGLTEAEARPFIEPNAPVEEIVGIGAMLHFDKELGAIVIRGSVPNSPAAEAGLNPGLILSKIDDTFTEGLKLAKCIELVRGAPGTVVRLEVVDPEQNETNVVELTRRRVVVAPAAPVSVPR